MGKTTFQGILVLMLGWAIWSGSLAAVEVREPRAGADGLLDSQGCRGCHEIQGKGGTFGPSLDGVGRRLDRAQLRRKLVNPAADTPDSRMPAFDYLDPQDLTILVDFLATL